MNTHRHWHQVLHASVVALVAVGSVTFTEVAAAAPIDHIRISQNDSLTTTEIELGCAMRYLGHSPMRGGAEVRVRLALGFDCHLELRGARHTLHQPRGRNAAYLTEIEFDVVTSNQVTITIRFERPIAVDVRQTSNEYLLTVTTDASVAPAISLPQTPPAVVAGRSTNTGRLRNETPARLIQRANPSQGDMFVIRLGDLGAGNDVDRDALNKYRSQVIYVQDVSVGNRQWEQWRLGFFETEGAALSVLAALRPSFPSAWISIAAPDEQAYAKSQNLAGRLNSERRPVATHQVPAAPKVARQDALPADRVATLMADAKTALMRANYGQSIKIYTRLLEEPVGRHRREAREFLGVARQKNGQLAHAKAEFEAYLLEFPDGSDANRVRQRLAALTNNGGRRPATVTARQAAQLASKWDVHGGVSQFYLRGVNLSRDDEEDVLTQSALLSQADFVIDRRGERFDLMARANLGYLYDFAESEPENQTLVSYAYVDIADNNLDLSARLGRQTQHKGGVLGRFDGAHLNYLLRPNLSVNVTGGLTVDSPRQSANQDHYFYGASIDFANFANAWDFSVFANQRTIDGILDRQAFGAEAQYHSSRLNIIGQLDYDASYAVLNSGLVIGNWRLNDRLTLNGRYQLGTNPFLTTRNAIIGQPVDTVEALLAIYSEGQVRRLARDRTAEAQSGSAGLSAELSQRWQLNADFTYDEHGSTEASGNVAAFPETGPQFFYGGHLLGSSIFKAGDSIILGYRHFESRSTDWDTVTVDLRYPAGEGLRINPRLALTLRADGQSMQGDSRHWIANPMLRVLYRWRRKYRIEFEIGGQWSAREMPPGSVAASAGDDYVKNSAYYVQLGYWVDIG